MEALGATILVGLGALGRLTAQWTLTEAIIPPNKVALDEHGRQVVGFRKTKRTNDFSRKRLQPQTTSTTIAIPRACQYEFGRALSQITITYLEILRGKIRYRVLSPHACILSTPKHHASTQLYVVIKLRLESYHALISE